MTTHNDADADADAGAGAGGEAGGLAGVAAELRRFVAARDWQQFHDPKNLAMLVASEAGELVAEYRWVPGDVADVHSREPEARARIADEIADVAIAVLLLSDRIGLDLARAIKDK